MRKVTLLAVALLVAASASGQEGGRMGGAGRHSGGQPDPHRAVAACPWVAATCDGDRYGNDEGCCIPRCQRLAR